jgi:intracellular sulfur oxidation DsrE/DsrF family protein
MPTSKATVYLFTNDGLGMTSDQALRHRLTATFLKLRAESELLPSVLCFYTDGVRLVCEGSPVLAELRALEEKGVRLVVCSTCLNVFGLEQQVCVGVVGGMGDIVTAMETADSAVTMS